MSAIDQLEQMLRDAAERRAGARAPRRRRSWRLIVVVAGASLLAGGAALAATQLLSIGAPVPASKQGLAAIEPGTARLLSVRAADPDGGPPWGLRVFRSKSGLACIQVGRAYKGRLGVLGQDGTFHNDGRFHELPVEAEGCGSVDARGQLFMDGGGTTNNASGVSWQVKTCETRQDRQARTGGDLKVLREALALQIRRHETAAARVQRRVIARYERRARQHIPLCDDRDLRDVIWGFAGSKAQRVTLDERGLHTTLTPAAGESGAYLFVLRGDYSQHQRLQRRVYYPHGIVCGRGYGVHATAGCSPPPGLALTAAQRRQLGAPAPKIPKPLHDPVTVLKGLSIGYTPSLDGHSYFVSLRCTSKAFAQVKRTGPLAGGRPVTLRLHPTMPQCMRRPLHGEIRDAAGGRIVAQF
jgi:hypothetical protein